MNATIAAVLQVLVLVLALAVVYRPFGDYMARIFESPRHTRVERGIYRLIGVDPAADQRWSRVPALGAGVLGGLGRACCTRCCGCRRYCRLARAATAMPPLQAFNTAVSFVTNTNWQSYSGEADAGLHRADGRAWRCRTSCPPRSASRSPSRSIRGFVRTRTDRLGQLLGRPHPRSRSGCCCRSRSIGGDRPACSRGVVQNFAGDTTVTTLAGGTQTIPGGPVASQEAIKELGTNGGGFFNANSAHPFENPNGVDQPARDLPAPADPVQPAADLRPDGRRPPPGLRDPRRDGDPVGRSVTALMLWAEVSARRRRRCSWPARRWRARRCGSGSRCPALFAAATTVTSTGAVNSMHDSYTAFGGGRADRRT